ncbi:MAG: hypothetical protein DME98_15420 [Verrucomicrobia bacterium]|nr:MAG: hypothetical protein DME98_15420 [Verrucomicrobiota bacterium]PYJ31985.1 MAG: hypothetical protein DME88_12655 [Verrucomicrobiota bacterium]
MITLGSGRVSRGGFGVAPKQSFLSVAPAVNRSEPKEKFAIARTRSPAREDACAPQMSAAGK